MTSGKSMAGERSRIQNQAGEIRVDVAELEEWNHGKPNLKSTAIPSTSNPWSTRPLPTRTELLSWALRNADHPCIRGQSDFFGVDLTTLQRLNLYNLQHELVQCATKMTSAEGDADTAFSSAAMADLHALLHRYIEALQDLRFVHDSFRDLHYRPAIFETMFLHSDQPGMRALLANVGLQQTPTGPLDPKLPRVPDGWDFDGTVLATERRQLSDFQERFFMAIFGGLALVGPVVIMSLLGTKTVCLATTAGCVTVVAVILARFMTEAQPKDVIAATAAYAAVLVVFVGATPSSNS